MIAGASAIAATPSRRRRAEVGRPLFAAASAILAIILLFPVSESPPNKLGDIVIPVANGPHPVNLASIRLSEESWILRPQERQQGWKRQVLCLNNMQWRLYGW